MNGGTKAVLIVLLIIFAVPIAALALSVAGVAVGAVVSVFGVAMAFILITVALVIAGIALIVVGFANMFSVAPAGILLCGIGFLLFGGGMLMALASVFICGTLLPQVVKGIVWLCKRPFQRKENAA